MDISQPTLFPDYETEVQTYKTKTEQEIKFKTLRNIENAKSDDIKARPGQIREEKLSYLNQPYQLKEGEFALAEKKYRETDFFDFTVRGNGKIYSTEDAAFIFRQLESQSVEHAFAVYVDENHDPTVQWLSMGTTTSTLIDPILMMDAAEKLKAKKVYFVHNHPSGNLSASEADKNISRTLNKIFSPIGIDIQSIIINLDSGKYALFDQIKTGIAHEPGEPYQDNSEHKIKVLTFDKRVFLQSPQQEQFKVTEPKQVATFLSQQRFSTGNKTGWLLINRAGVICGNFFETEPINEKSIKGTRIKLARLASLFGASIIIGYGNEDISNKNIIRPLEKYLDNINISFRDYIVTESSKEVQETYSKYTSLMNEGKFYEPEMTYNSKFEERVEDIIVQLEKQGKTVTKSNIILQSLFSAGGTLAFKDQEIETFLASKYQPINRNAMDENIVKETEPTYQNPNFFGDGDKVKDIYNDNTYLVIEHDKRGMAKLKELSTGKISFFNADNNRRFLLVEKGIQIKQADMFEEKRDENKNVEAPTPTQYVQTNMGDTPIEDYREMRAMQSGFDSYEDMYKQGYRLGDGYDKSPEQSKTHFIVLAPMHGEYEGKIAQHSILQTDKEAAKRWAEGRFTNPDKAVIVDMREHNNAESLSLDVANDIYTKGIKEQNTSLIYAIDKAIHRNDFSLHPDSDDAILINDAEKKGYVFRASHTQVEWNERGLKELLANSNIQDKVIEKSIADTAFEHLTGSSGNLENKIDEIKERNIDYLANQAKFLGFGDDLKEEIRDGVSFQPLPDSFTLPLTKEYFSPFNESRKQEVSYRLNFNKSNKSDMYFLNSYSASIKNNENEMTETFLLNKGKGFTSKEAYNLLSGRSVYKEMTNKVGEKYNAWIKMKPEPGENGRRSFVVFNEKNGFNLEAEVNKLSLTNSSAQKKDALIQSLKKGNIQEVSVIGKNGKDTTNFVEATPQFKNLTTYNYRGDKQFVVHNSKENKTKQTIRR